MDIKELFADFPGERLRWNEPMSAHTSFKAGGPADLLFTPGSRQELCRALDRLQDAGVKYFVMGNGSNLLVRDGGYRGVIIKLGEGMDGITRDGARITAEGGALLSRVAAAALNAGLTGLEFASGIPGSFGGAVCMNAGAYESEIKDVLVCTEVFAGGRIMTLTNAELELSYRSSRVQREGMIVLSGTVLLTPGDIHSIKSKTKELNDSRRDKQPLEFPSAGSTFKRPPGHFAGKLIMDCGLAGYAIGGAEVSRKHCGFIINTGNAASSDILRLMEYVTDSVRQKFGIELEPEVKIIGDE